MIYIKNDNGIITLGGTVANQRMLDEGYFEYSGDIPTVLGDFQTLGWDGQTIIVNTDLTAYAKQITDEIQKLLDNEAQVSGYDNIFTAITYIGDANAAYDAEGQSFKTWRGAVWTYAETELGKLIAGTRTIIPIEEFILELPERVQ